MELTKKPSIAGKEKLKMEKAEESGRRIKPWLNCYSGDIVLSKSPSGSSLYVHSVEEIYSKPNLYSEPA